MTVSEAKNRISKVNNCLSMLNILLENEKEPFYRDGFECNKRLLEEYKEFLLEKIESAELS